MKKSSAILLSLLAIISCMPQKTSANAGGALVCLTAGVGLGALALSTIHPKTSDYWDIYKLNRLSESEKETAAYKAADLYFNWRLRFHKRSFAEKTTDFANKHGGSFFQSAKGLFKTAKEGGINQDTDKIMLKGCGYAIAELSCLLIATHFVIKAATRV